MNIAVVGTGYVGLVTGTCFAETGNTVICVDISVEKINSLKAGKVPIFEPDLDTLFERNVKYHRLFFTTNLAEAVQDAEVIFLALPTPPGEDGSADLKYILGVADELGKLIIDYKVIVDKSTVPVGTAEKVRAAIAKNAKTEFDVASNPEFLREGVAVDDFMRPDRVVIGTSSERARKKLDTLYEPFVRQGNPIIYMDERSAEMTKYAANAYLATRISFMNEIANVCERVGANVDMVRKGIGSDNRIGKRFLFPGIGYGGSCFPKDVKALHKTAQEYQYDFKILDAVMKVNSIQKLILFEKIKDYFNGKLKDKVIGIWGLAFKPNTDDIREAPALYIIEALLNEGASIIAYDPEAIENTKSLFGNRIQYGSSPYEAAEDVDALAILTEWSEFRTPDFKKLSEIMKQKVIFDGRNVFNTNTPDEYGFYYNSIGRVTIKNT